MIQLLLRSDVRIKVKMMISKKTVIATQGSVLHIPFSVIGLGQIRNPFDHPTGDSGYVFFKDSYR